MSHIHVSDQDKAKIEERVDQQQRECEKQQDAKLQKRINEAINEILTGEW